MNQLIELAATTGITEIVKLGIEKYIKPKLEGFGIGNTLLLENKFDEYISRSYNKHLYMNTIVFKNQQKTINDLYIPLTVIKSDNKHHDDTEVITIDTFPSNFIPKYKKVLLIDSAGMGKSTILKYLYLMSIKHNIGIPILIELRKLGQTDSIIDFIINEINGIGLVFKKNEICSLIEGGDFIFFFDGYDEIIDENKSIVTENMQDFISKADNNLFIISSREEGSLSCFGNFQRFDIRPLEKSEAYNLIKKYDNDGELSKQLINKLEDEENLKIINEFLTNPLMVSLLYKAFEYKSSVPYKKNIFYRQVYDALFEDHDRSKGSAYVHEKKSKLDIEDFCLVLRALGFLTLKEGISYSKEELINFIKKVKKIAIGVEFSENDFIYDIVNSVPLFIKEGTEYKWTHKSFQEYFAASYICIDAKEKESKYLQAIFNSNNVDRYYNVLDFCYDMNYKDFRKNAIYPIICDFTKHYKSAYESDYYNDFNKPSVNIRKNLTFIFDDIFIRKDNNLDNKKESAKADKFTEAFKGWKAFNNIGLRATIIWGSKVCIGCIVNSRNSVLLKLLNTKHSSIVKKISKIKVAEDYSIFRDGEYILNDDISNELNKKDIFDLVNNLILMNLENRNSDTLTYDYNKCLKLIKEIEEEKRFEMEDIEFL